MFNAARLASKDVPASRELGLGDGLDQFRSIVVKAGTDPAKIKTLSDALDKVAAMPEYRAFLEKEAAGKDSFVLAKNAVAFMQTELDAMKKVVDALPLHARYIINASEVETYTELF